MIMFLAVVPSSFDSQISNRKTNRRRKQAASRTGSLTPAQSDRLARSFLQSARLIVTSQQSQLDTGQNINTLTVILRGSELRDDPQ